MIKNVVNVKMQIAVVTKVFANAVQRDAAANTILAIR